MPKAEATRCAVHAIQTCMARPGSAVDHFGESGGPYGPSFCSSGLSPLLIAHGSRHTPHTTHYHGSYPSGSATRPRHRFRLRPKGASPRRRESGGIERHRPFGGERHAAGLRLTPIRRFRAHARASSNNACSGHGRFDTAEHSFHHVG